MATDSLTLNIEAKHNDHPALSGEGAVKNRKARLSIVDSEILEAARTDAVVNGCIQLYKNGDLEYRGMLEMMVLELLREKSSLQRELLNKIAHSG